MFGRKPKQVQPASEALPSTNSLIASVCAPEGSENRWFVYVQVVFRLYSEAWRRWAKDYHPEWDLNQVAANGYSDSREGARELACKLIANVRQFEQYPVYHSWYKPGDPVGDFRVTEAECNCNDGGKS